MKKARNRQQAKGDPAETSIAASQGGPLSAAPLRLLPPPPLRFRHRPLPFLLKNRSFCRKMPVTCGLTPSKTKRYTPHVPSNKNAPVGRTICARRCMLSNNLARACSIREACPTSLAWKCLYVTQLPTGCVGSTQWGNGVYPSLYQYSSGGIRLGVSLCVFEIHSVL